MIDDRDPDLERALRSHADAMDVPWVPLRRRRPGASRLVVLATVVSVLVLAVIAGGALGARRQSVVNSSGAAGAPPQAAAPPTAAVAPSPGRGASSAAVLSPDGKNVVDGRQQGVLAIDNDQIVEWFRTQSQLCHSNINTWPNIKTWPAFCTDKATFKAKTWFASVVSSPDGAEVGFTITMDPSSDPRFSDSGGVAGIFIKSTGKVQMLSSLYSYYLSEQFIGFSPTGKNFVYQGGCFEGNCALFVRDSVTLAEKVSVNTGDDRHQSATFVRWLSDSQFEYKLGTELKTAPPAGIEAPVVVLELPVGNNELPGVTPAAPGGVVARGPQSVTVERGRTYLWDEANQRVLIYEGRNVVGKVALPQARLRGVALVVDSGRIYLREQDDSGAAIYEDEFDAVTGARLRSASLRAGDGSIYPRERSTLPVSSIAKGTGVELGVDAVGNRYRRTYTTPCAGASCGEVDRFDRTGAIVARALVAETPRFEDLAVASDGGVYGLSWRRDASDQIIGVFVTRLLAPTP